MSTASHEDTTEPHARPSDAPNLAEKPTVAPCSGATGLPALAPLPDGEFFPIPPAERALPTVEAELFCAIDLGRDTPADKSLLEGLAFTHDGDLLVCNPPTGRIYRLDMEQRTARLWCQLPGDLQPTAAKLHRDGRVFATCVSFVAETTVVALTPEGEIDERIVASAEHLYDDLVFDRTGGFYLSDLSGSIAHPVAGVWYVGPGEHEAQPVVEGMIMTNGIALAPEGDALWVTEFGTGRLHRLNLDGNHRVARFGGSHVAYHFTGLEGPDSACIDAAGNLYVALCGQGRFLVFNRHGAPVGQVLIPGRDEGRMLMSTHPQLRPGTSELYLCSADTATGEAAIFRARALAPAHPGFAFS